MNERQLLQEILVRAELTERRARNIQFRGIRMEKTIMALSDDMAGLKASVAALIAAFQAAQTNVQAIVDAAVAADEAGTDVDVKQMQADITNAMAPATAAAAAAQPST